MLEAPLSWNWLGEKEPLHFFSPISRVSVWVGCEENGEIDYSVGGLGSFRKTGFGGVGEKELGFFLRKLLM